MDRALGAAFTTSSWTTKISRGHVTSLNRAAGKFVCFALMPDTSVELTVKTLQFSRCTRFESVDSEELWGPEFHHKMQKAQFGNLPYGCCCHHLITTHTTNKWAKKEQQHSCNVLVLSERLQHLMTEMLTRPRRSCTPLFEANQVPVSMRGSAGWT